LNDQCVIEDIRVEKKSLEEHENENTIYQNLWDTAKMVLRGKNIAMGVYIKRIKK
jgi:deoxyadenosine/deoxycytidine kinase